jgi:hypothetical protein
MDVGFGQGLVDASLVSPQSTAALQEQRYAIEWQPPVGGREVWSGLKVHVFCALGLRLSKPVFCPVRDVVGFTI